MGQTFTETSQGTVGKEMPLHECLILITKTTKFGYKEKQIKQSKLNVEYVTGEKRRGEEKSAQKFPAATKTTKLCYKAAANQTATTKH